MKQEPQKARAFWIKISLIVIFLTAISALFYKIWGTYDLPASQEFLNLAQSYFEKYGYLVIFISALIEGFLFIGFYYPGSIVIFLGVILAGDSPFRVALVISLTIIGLLITYVANYFIGKYGWYRFLLAIGLKQTLLKAQKRLKKYGGKSIFLSYWHPNLAAITATAAGIIQINFKKFFTYSIVATIIWSVFWGIIAYALGESLLIFIGIRFALIAFGIWIIIQIIYARSKNDETIKK